MSFADKAWNEISDETLDGLCDSFWGRCEDVIRKEVAASNQRNHSETLAWRGVVIPLFTVQHPGLCVTWRFAR
jgi:hypothetical protein